MEDGQRGEGPRKQIFQGLTYRSDMGVQRGLPSAVAYQEWGGASCASWSSPCVCAWYDVRTPQSPGLRLWPCTTALSGMSENPLGPAPTAGLRQWIFDGCFSGALHEHF